MQWLLMLAVAIEASLHSLRQDYYQLKNDIPPDALSDVLLEVDQGIELVEATNEYLNFIGKPDEIDSESTGLGEVVAIVHSDIIFVGFPHSAIQVMKEKWFDKMRRDDFLPAHDSLQGRSTPLGSPKIKHVFNVVQTSFKVADAIRDRLQYLSKGFNNSQPFYVNSWEVEALLTSLRDSLSFANAIPIDFGDGVNVGAKVVFPKVSSSIFVLNVRLLDQHQAPLRYEYRHGFSDIDLVQLASSPDILKRCASMMKNISRTRRVELGPDLAGQQLPVADGESHQGSTGSFRKDAVLSSRAWADSVLTETLSFGSEVRMCMYINVCMYGWMYICLYIYVYMLCLISSYSQTLQGFSLQKRAERILDSELHGYSLAKKVMDAAIGRIHNVNCSASTWVGSKRLSWIDIQAASDSSPSHLTSVRSAPPSPRSLNEAEWLRLGMGSQVSLAQSNEVEQVQSEVHRARLALHRHLLRVSGLLKQSQCMQGRGKDVLSKADFASGSAQSPRQLVSAFLRSVAADVFAKRIQSHCVVLVLQRELLNSTLLSSMHIIHSLDGLLESSTLPSAEAIAREVLVFHAKALYETLDASNVMIDVSPLHAEAVSEEAVVYLGYLSAELLRLARVTISPSLAVTAREREDIRSIRSAVLASGQSSPRLVDAYNGELLSDLVAGLSLKQNRATPSAHFYAASLNQLILPSRIDLVVYVVKTQDSYRPLGSMILIFLC